MGIPTQVKRHIFTEMVHSLFYMVNIMATEDLALCIPRASAGII